MGLLQSLLTYMSYAYLFTPSLFPITDRKLPCEHADSLAAGQSP